MYIEQAHTYIISMIAGDTIVMTIYQCWIRSFDESYGSGYEIISMMDYAAQYNVVAGFQRIRRIEGQLL